MNQIKIVSEKYQTYTQPHTHTTLEKNQLERIKN